MWVIGYLVELINCTWVGLNDNIFLVMPSFEMGLNELEVETYS